MIAPSIEVLLKRQAEKIAGLETNPPGEGFDPLAASEEELLHHRLPPRPDPRGAPSAFANWTRAMASRPRFIKYVPPAGTQIRQMLISRADRGATQTSSRNWSGAVVRPRNFDPMALVQGRWVVPDTPPPSPGSGFASSVWVGIDGFDPTSRVMPQIGTGQYALNIQLGGIPLFWDRQVAWWQVWLRDDPMGLWQVEINMPVGRGERMYGQVHVLNEYVVSLFLKNESTNIAFAGYYDLRNAGAATAANPFECRTAEWVVERPRTPDPDTGDPVDIPFTAYGETAFTACNAASLAANGMLGEFQLQRAPLIRMNLWDDRTVPGRLASLPRRVGDDALLMRYVDR